MEIGKQLYKNTPAMHVVMIVPVMFLHLKHIKHIGFFGVIIQQGRLLTKVW